jgi:hypothetical protein
MLTASNTGTAMMTDAMSIVCLPGLKNFIDQNFYEPGVGLFGKNVGAPGPLFLNTSMSAGTYAIRMITIMMMSHGLKLSKNDTRFSS